MKIAVEGCAHGELETIYESLQFLEKKENIKIDLLICCGDFQATRNSQDLSCMAVSQKYRNICSFYKYYSGEKVAPILTLFIGGNHEASNHLQELSYGGWAAPNIYYLGYAGVVNVGGIRIAGLSGIYKGRDYMRGHYEMAPYTEESKRSVYHIRNLEVFRLKQLSQHVDVMLSHDWPRGVTEYGDTKLLLEKKPFFRKDIEEGLLGSKPAEELLHDLKPTHWFAAHLHCKFPAIVPHGPRKGVTKFLALDKCLPRRKFLQVMEFEHDETDTLELCYDLEWLTIVHLTNHLLSVKKGLTYMPGRTDHERWLFTPTEDEKNLIWNRFGGDLKVPKNFTRTVQPYTSTDDSGQTCASAQLNPQTTAFCEKLGVDDPLALLMEGCSQGTTPNSKSISSSFCTPDRSRDFSQVSFTSEDSSFDLCSNSNGSLNTMPLKRSSLTLPPPKTMCLDDSSDDFISLSTGPDKISLNKDITQVNDRGLPNTSTKHRTQPDPEPSEETKTPVKKFKRRNQALYINLDDE